MDQDSGVLAVPLAVGGAGLAGSEWRAGSESDRVHHSQDRRLDAHLPGAYSCHHSGAQALATTRTDPVPQDAWAVPFFYGFLHFSTWIGLDKFFDLAEMLHDVRSGRSLPPASQGSL
jgi:hypothetical protein